MGALQRFTFDLDCEVFEKASPDGKERRIGGIVSTSHLDRQAEELLQEGLDFKPFLSKGFFNDNHSPDTEGVIGYPEKAELRTLPDGHKGWYVEGYLLKGHARADRIWELANALQKHDRKLGFSVEGQVLERDPKQPTKVRKAVVREVAVTKCPVNTQTSLEVLAKSLSVGHTATPAAVEAGPGDASPLTVQSLESELTPRKKKKKRYTKSEAVARLQTLDPSLGPLAAAQIVDYAMEAARLEGENHAGE